MQFKSELYNKLLDFRKLNRYPFHMPGHKRNSNEVSIVDPFEIDITEIEGFDNLHNPEDIIKREMDRAAKFYGSKKSYFLVNGSTCGNMAAISSIADVGDKIIVARNCHKSVYNVIDLLKLKVEYLYPEIIDEYGIAGAYKPEDVEQIISENHDAKAIVITSPTYEGVVSDVETICEIAHNNNMAVIVDSAHGAHFILSDSFPKSALQCKADIVIESLHKTLPSLTQTGILHFNSEIIKQEKVEKYLSVFQSSSPSYILMSSITNCINFMSESSPYVDKYLNNICNLIERINELEHFKLLDDQSEKIYKFDISKIVIICCGYEMAGIGLMEILREKYNLEMEMAAGSYVIAMTSVLDSEEGFLRLAEALEDIDKNYDEIIKLQYNRNVNKEKCTKLSNSIYHLKNEKVCEIFEAEMISSSDSNCSKEISKKYVYLYPPGIPLIVPGEIPNDKLVKEINNYRNNGYQVIEG
ncbi:MAG: aminotransferase class V-fold PLP-dependent enzyme [Lachnospiraceae bacterium]|nr:aminotransferase class V-fold PLP-dependent enzyme [Lachnospiraceae bacterium]